MRLARPTVALAAALALGAPALTAAPLFTAPAYAASLAPVSVGSFDFASPNSTNGSFEAKMVIDIPDGARAPGTISRSTLAAPLT